MPLLMLEPLPPLLQPPLSCARPVSLHFTPCPLLPPASYLVAQGSLPSAWLFEVPHQSLLSILDVRGQELPVFSLCHLGFTSRGF